MQNKKKCSSLCDKKIDIRSLLKNKLIAKCAEQSKTSKKKIRELNNVSKRPERKKIANPILFFIIPNHMNRKVPKI